MRVHQRHHRPVLPAVRADDRRFDGHLGLQFADAQPGPGGPFAAAGPTPRRTCRRDCSICCWAGSSASSTATFRRSTSGYTRHRRLAAARWRLLVLVRLRRPALARRYWGCQQLPTGFIPNRRTWAICWSASNLPDRLGVERTKRGRERKIDKIVHDDAGRRSTSTRVGPIVHAQRQRLELRLDVRHPRGFRPARAIRDLYQRRPFTSRSAQRIAAEVPEAHVSHVRRRRRVRAWAAPAASRSWSKTAAISGCRRCKAKPMTLVEAAKTNPVLTRACSRRSAPTMPQLYVDVEPRPVPDAWDVSLSDVFDTLQIYLGSLYVNDFNRFGRTWQVIVQADAQFRDNLEDGQPPQGAQRDRRDGAAGGAWPTIKRDQRTAGPRRATTCTRPPRSTAAPAAGVSSGQAIEVMEQLADEVAAAKRWPVEWTEITYHANALPRTPAWSIFGLAVVFVFLVLAAQYESWSLPLAVILVVPMCILVLAHRRWLTVGPATSTSSRRSASWCWSAWRARTPF